jgi:hypothetical protein
MVVYATNCKYRKEFHRVFNQIVNFFAQEIEQYQPANQVYIWV